MMLILILLGSAFSETCSRGDKVGVASGLLSPYGLAASWDGAFLYVTERGSSTVSVVNTKTDSVSALVNGVTDPEGLALSSDGGFLYVASTTEILKVDTETGDSIQLVGGLNHPRNLALSPDGWLYLTQHGSGNVFQVNTKGLPGAVSYTRYGGYSGEGGNDISCGLSGEAANEAACSANSGCKGFSSAPNGWWCLKASTGQGPYQGAGAVWFLKIYACTTDGDCTGEDDFCFKQSRDGVTGTHDICSGSGICVERQGGGGICTREYAPVCGCNGDTLSTACVARANDVSYWHDGECCNAQQVWDPNMGECVSGLGDMTNWQNTPLAGAHTHTIETLATGLTGPDGLALSSDGAWLYVAEGGDFNRISKVNTETGDVTSGPGIGRTRIPYGLALTSNEAYLYMTDQGAGKVYAIGENGITTSLAEGLNNPYALALSFDETWLYVAEVGLGTVSRICTGRARPAQQLAFDYTSSRGTNKPYNAADGKLNTFCRVTDKWKGGLSGPQQITRVKIDNSQLGRRKWPKLEGAKVFVKNEKAGGGRVQCGKKAGREKTQTFQCEHKKGGFDTVIILHPTRDSFVLAEVKVYGFYRAGLEQTGGESVTFGEGEANKLTKVMISVGALIAVLLAIGFVYWRRANAAKQQRLEDAQMDSEKDPARTGDQVDQSEPAPEPADLSRHPEGEQAGETSTGAEQPAKIRQVSIHTSSAARAKALAAVKQDKDDTEVKDTAIELSVAS